jgi:hypothetical protein
VPSRRHNRGPNQSAISKTARLEKKLDNIVSLLRVGAHHSVTDAETVNHIDAPVKESKHLRRTVANSTTSSYADLETESRSEAGNNIYDSSLGALEEGTSAFEPTPSHLPRFVSPWLYHPLSIEATEHLNFFQAHSSKYFPFVHIPSTTSTEQLYHDRPFLYLCIIGTSPRISAQQQVLSQQIRQEISQKMLDGSENNIDLLLGVLTYIGWYVYLDTKRLYHHPLTYFT